MVRKCGDDRPADRAGETTQKTRAFELDDIAEMPVALVAYPGCVEGDRLTLGVKGDQRAVLAYGTAEQVARYAIGESVDVNGGSYQRNPSRKQQEAVTRIKEEMTGTGEIARIAKEKGGNYGGYTFTVNGQKVSPTSVLNSFFQEMVYVQDANPEFNADLPDGRDNQQYLKTSVPADKADPRKVMNGQDGEPLKFMGGVEMVVTAIITPGSEYKA